MIPLCLGKNRLGSEEQGAETAEDIKKSMSNEEWETVYMMSKDKNLYHNLIQSMFPTIFGNDEVGLFFCWLRRYLLICITICITFPWIF